MDHLPPPPPPPGTIFILPWERLANLPRASCTHPFQSAPVPPPIPNPQEETGWELVHGDVFRTPEYPQMLATYIGTGCQLLGIPLCIWIGSKVK